MSIGPLTVRNAAIGAICAGLTLFAVTSAVNAVAGPARPTLTSIAAPAEQAPTQMFEQSSSAAGSVEVLAAKPGVKPVATAAPIDHSIISGLASNGIPTVALNAYRVAAARLAHVEPGCGIDWALLAGIGREESDHGRFAGAVLHASGVSTPRIIGIALNGSGTALIPDTDHGRLDGDTVYDRAVGPMQFIPSTWALYGTDANGDGKADVFNINDAALTAARYLCAAGGDLRTHAGQVAAVLAYNHSSQYLSQVLALAHAYRLGISINGIPVGNTTGALGAVKHHGTPPPVNPGTPTANTPTAKAKPGATTTTPPGSATTPAGSAATPTKPTTPAPTGTARTPVSEPPGTGSSGATPTPTPTKCALPDLLNPGHCAIR